jgi:hypothetical protein
MNHENRHYLSKFTNGLSVRAANVLVYFDYYFDECKTIEEVKLCCLELIKDNKLKKARGCGIKTENEIRKWVGVLPRPKYNPMMQIKNWKYNPITGEPLNP